MPKNKVFGQAGGKNVGIEKAKIFGEKSKFMFYIYR